MRLSVRRIMALALMAGVSLAAARLHPALGCFTAAASGLALIRTFGKIDRSLKMDSSEVIGTFFASVAVSTTIIVTSIMPGICLLPMIDQPEMHSVMKVVGLGVAALLALPIAIVMRRKLW